MSEMKPEKKQEKMESEGAESVKPIQIKVIYGKGNLIDCMESVIRLQGMFPI